MTPLLFLLSLIIGIAIGISGVGGVLLIPVLVYCGGLSIHHAMGTALFSFFFTGLIASYAYQKHGSIDWKITVPVCLGSVLTSYLGAYVNALVNSFFLYLLLSFIIISSSLYSMIPTKSTSFASGLSLKGQRNTLLVIGIFVGFLSGLTGIGGGLVSIPVMLTLGFPVLASIATGQVLQGIVAIFGSVSNISNNFVDFEIVWWVTLAEIVGVLIGAKIAHKISFDILKKGVSIFSLLLAFYMLATAFI